MKVLYINAAVRDNSRTKTLAEYFLEKLGGDVCEVRTGELDFQATDAAFLAKRDKACQSGDFSDKEFDCAKQFAQADVIVIAAPFWDLSFPAALKQYFEQICVRGITFYYTKEGIPVGLCRAKGLTYITTAGGDFFPEEYGAGYVKALAGNFYGIPEFRLIKATGLDIIGADVDGIIDAVKKEL